MPSALAGCLQAQWSFWLLGIPVLHWQHADLEHYLGLIIIVPLFALALVAGWAVLTQGHSEHPE